MINRVLFILCLALILAGCGNVTLKGEAVTAAQESAMDAYQASVRYDAATSQPAGSPTWTGDYLRENFAQWRSFVRAANKDPNWGPKLPAEGGAK